MFSYVEVVILINAKAKSKTKIKIKIFFRFYFHWAQSQLNRLYESVAAYFVDRQSSIVPQAIDEI